MKRRWTWGVLLAAALIVSCKKDEPKSTRWDDAAAVTVTVAPSSSVPALPTGSFN